MVTLTTVSKYSTDYQIHNKEHKKLWPVFLHAVFDDDNDNDDINFTMPQHIFIEKTDETKIPINCFSLLIQERCGTLEIYKSVSFFVVAVYGTEQSYLEFLCCFTRLLKLFKHSRLQKLNVYILVQLHKF